MDSKIKKRLWIRNFIIIFLIILLLLTFFSNTIMNYTLPEVSVKYPNYQTITSKISGNGVVTANQSVQVTLQETRVVDKIMVSRGQKVYRGDVLFTLTQNDSAELSDAKDALRSLEFELISLKSQELSDSQAVEEQIAAKQAEIEQIKKTIATKETALDKLNELNKTIEALEANNALQNNNIENSNKEIVKTENLRQEAMNGYSVPYSVLYEGISGAKQLKTDALLKVSSQEGVITKLNKDRASLVSVKNEQKEQLTSKEKDVARLEETLSTYDTFMNISESYKIRYDIELLEEEHNALTAYNNAISEYTRILQATLNPNTPEALTAMARVNSAKEKYESYTGGYYYSDEYYNALLNIKTQQLANSFEYGLSAT
ncbi:MAG: HlyD family secretion protein [Lachnospiraceae bacterium]|nr:HlyD family secretion protein [Lachnospiraceae bacterium]